MKTYKGFITKLGPNEIFIFGSNTEGRHGLGAAKQAMKFGAVYGQAAGRQGNTYAIITKDLAKGMRSISKGDIGRQIGQLYQYAEEHPELTFYVAYSGTGQNLNGYTNLEMAQLFFMPASEVVWDQIPPNMVFEEKFAELIEMLEEEWREYGLRG